MEHENNRASRDTDDKFHGNGLADQQQPAIKHGIQPSATVPPTVLVTELDNGTLIVQGRPNGPRVWLNPDEAVPLKRELAVVFGRIRFDGASGGQGEAR